jgi:hypothetical protein
MVLGTNVQNIRAGKIVKVKVLRNYSHANHPTENRLLKIGELADLFVVAVERNIFHYKLSGENSCKSHQIGYDEVRFMGNQKVKFASLNAIVSLCRCPSPSFVRTRNAEI